MEVETFFWKHWYYFGPLYIFSVLFWTLMGRFLLQFFVRDPKQNYIMNAFVKITSPVYAVGKYVTPSFLHPFTYPLYYGFWMLVLRFGFHIVMFNMGLTPSLEGVVEVG